MPPKSEDKASSSFRLLSRSPASLSRLDVSLPRRQKSLPESPTQAPVSFDRDLHDGGVSDLRRCRRFFAGRLAGAVGLEPTPSSLTVRCPTNWTTPQPDHFILTAPRQEPKLRLINFQPIFCVPSCCARNPLVPGLQAAVQFRDERKACDKVIHRLDTMF